MAQLVWEFPADYDGQWPCPQGCGRLTEDPYGGPCRCCWNAVDDQEQQLRSVLGDTSP